MDVSIHKTTKVVMYPIQERNRPKGKRKFFTRRIEITSTWLDNESHEEVNLFGESAEALELQYAEED